MIRARSPVAAAATIVSEVLGSSDIDGIVGRDGGELPPSAEVGGVEPLEKLPSPRDRMDPLLGMPPRPSDPVGCVCMWHLVSG